MASPLYSAPTPAAAAHMLLEQAHNAAESAASRPSLGFPLGTALLLIVIFSLSGIFSCCYHWDKFRALRGAYADDGDIEAGSSDEKPQNSEVKRQEINESVPVIMPGNQIPTFIALPCPCAPPRGFEDLSSSTNNIQVDQKPQKPPGSPVPSSP